MSELPILATRTRKHDVSPSAPVLVIAPLLAGMRSAGSSYIYSALSIFEYTGRYGRQMPHYLCSHLRSSANTTAQREAAKQMNYVSGTRN